MNSPPKRRSTQLLVTAWRWTKSQQKPVSLLLLLLTALLIGNELTQVWPSRVNLEIALEEHARGSDRADLTYLLDGELVLQSSLRYPDGIPHRLALHPELPPGQYTLEIRLFRAEEAPRELQARFTCPSEGLIRVYPRARP